MRCALRAATRPYQWDVHEEAVGSVAQTSQGPRQPHHVQPRSGAQHNAFHHKRRHQQRARLRMDVSEVWTSATKRRTASLTRLLSSVPHNPMLSQLGYRCFQRLTMRARFTASSAAKSSESIRGCHSTGPLRSRKAPARVEARGTPAAIHSLHSRNNGICKGHAATSGQAVPLQAGQLALRALQAVRRPSAAACRPCIARARHLCADPRTPFLTCIALLSHETPGS
jgi:hypothetical protein